MHACLNRCLLIFCQSSLSQVIASKLTSEIVTLCGALLALGAVALLRSLWCHACYGTRSTLSENIMQGAGDKSCVMDATYANASLVSVGLDAVPSVIMVIMRSIWMPCQTLKYLQTSSLSVLDWSDVRSEVEPRYFVAQVCSVTGTAHSAACRPVTARKCKCCFHQ